MASRPPVSERIRTAVRVEGIVQGVGFRPFVYSLATRLGLGGLVGNDVDGVFAEVEGDPAAVEAFLSSLARDAPPLARIERITTAAMRPDGTASFAIAPSEPGTAAADAGVRRHRDLRGLPGRARRSRRPAVRLPVHQLHELRPAVHDRPRRALRPAAHHDGAASRCASGAPRSTTTRRTAASTPSRSAARPAVPRLSLLGPGRDGQCRGPPLARPRRTCSARARCWRSRAWAATTWPWTRPVRRPPAALRARKHREDKPFAVMVADLAAAQRLCEVDEAAAALLASGRRPIVLLPRRPRARLAARGRPREPAARADAAVHPAAPPAARGRRRPDGADQRQRLRRADRVPGRRGARSGWPGSPTPSSPTTGRSRSGPTTRWCGRSGAGRRCSAGPAATCRSRSTWRSGSPGRCWPAGPS